MLASSSRILLRTATAMGGRTAVKAVAARVAASSFPGVSESCRKTVGWMDTVRLIGLWGFFTAFFMRFDLKDEGIVGLSDLACCSLRVVALWTA